MKTPQAKAPLDLAALRKEYARETLDESAIDRDPMKQFAAWMAEAVGAQVPEPTAMTVPSTGFSLAVSGMMMPPRICSASSILLIITLS